ncbi:SGNH/GDSL hydrolase family protein [Chromobacterium amazonense]|uniref:SGNH/GDSL hydrolase family protein n=1 Tax=Chromobacterium amazonense TaxID=1382803 RepID=UPI001CB9B606|nr:SGNH/GDSL hydrolase family protein [Chromobacterium amazonense]
MPFKIVPGRLLAPWSPLSSTASNFFRWGDKVKQVKMNTLSPPQVNEPQACDEPDGRSRLFALALKNREIQPSQARNGKTLDHIKHLVLVGDSLSDTKGRMRSKTLGIMLSSRQYYAGRFTNGFAWPDFAASPKFLDKPLLNYAEGGAVAGKYSKLNPTFMFISNMDRQIKKHDFKPDDMAVLALGANDYMTFGKTNVDKVIRAHEKQIVKLVKKGVKNILVTGIPDLSKTVFARSPKQKPLADKLVELSRLHNERLRELVEKLRKDDRCNGAEIRFFDISEKMDYLMKLSQEKDVKYDTCFNKHEGYIDLPRVFGFAGDTRPLDTSHRYVFHDEVHPSQEVHQILASHITDFIWEEYGRPD